MAKIQNPYLSSSLPSLSKDDFKSGVINEAKSLSAQHDYNQALAAAEYESALQLMYDERSYNSPQNQAALMRAAGINPDLQNLPSHAGSAGSFHGAPNAQTASANRVSSSSTSDFVLNASKMFFDVLPQAIQTFQGMKLNIQQSDLNELRLMKEADSIARLEIAEQLDLSDLAKDKDIPWVNLDRYKTGSRNQKRIQANIDRYLADSNNRLTARGLLYENKGFSESYRQGFLKLLGSFGYNINDESFAQVIKTFNDVLNESKQAEYRYNKDYYESADGNQAGQTFNAQNKKASTMTEDFNTKLTKSASKLFDSDKITDKSAGILLYVISSLLSGGMPISFRTNNTYNQNQIK